MERNSNLPERLQWAAREMQESDIRLEVFTDAMDNGTSESILQGDTVICVEVENWSDTNPGRNYVLVNRSGKHMVCRIVKIENNHIHIHRLNPDYPDIGIPIESIETIYEIIERRRVFKLPDED